MRDADPLAVLAKARGNAPALEDESGVLSYADLDGRVEVAARRLASLTGGPGERAALVLPPCREAVELLHAGPRAGVVLAPLSSRLTPSELSAALEALRPAVVVCHPRTRDAVAAAGGSWPVVEAGPGPRGRAESGTVPPGGDSGRGRPNTDAPPAFEDVEPRDLPGGLEPEQVAYVLWTSGTSGRPRGVCLTLRALEASASGSRERLGLSSDDRWLASLSPAHVGGLALLTRAVLLGSSVVVRPGFDAAELSRLADEGGVSHASLVPVMLRRLLDHREGRRAPSGLRCLLVGGAHAPAKLVRRALERGYPVALTYGMTETTSQAATSPPERVREKPDTVGRPLPGVEIRIAQGGEIRVRGATLAAGYLAPGRARPEPLDLDGEGWLHTGDLGRIDGEGELHVTGRRSDRIVSGGVTVDAREVEEALRSLPGVADAAVVGVPDPEWGERVAALVVLAQGAGDADRARAELDGALRARLSGPKRPRLLGFAEALPRNRNGKVERSAVRRILVTGGGPPPPLLHGSADVPYDP